MSEDENAAQDVNAAFETMENRAIRTLRQAKASLQQQIEEAEKSIALLQEEIEVLEFVLVRLTQKSETLQ